MTQKVWLVTGCSSGLGNELVQQIVRRGDKAIATARNEESLKTLANEGAATIQLDITASEHLLKQKAREAIESFGHIDVIVHNAGHFQMGSWEDLTHELLLRQFHTNVFGPINLTRALLPHLRERNDGTIVFIGSTSAWVTYAGASVYGASKATIGHAAYGLAREVGPFGIKVLSIDAGGFGSQLVSNALNHRPPSQHYKWLMDAIQDSFQWVVENNPGDTTKLANLIIDLVKSEGVAEGKKIPPRIPKGPNDMFEKWAHPGPNDIPLSLPAGSDAIDAIKARCEEVLGVINQWESVIRSTDIKANG